MPVASTKSSALDYARAMKRYAAFLRGVMPTNCKMPDLKRAFEAAGFKDVKTVLGSGNVVFGASGGEAALVKKAEAAMAKHLGRSFATIVRSIDSLQELLDRDPYAAFRLPAGSKRVVTFVRGTPKGRLKLPIERDGARILAQTDSEVLSSYTRTPKGPVFMVLIEESLGKDVTTRTWETIQRVVKAAS
jgi:uncharacterized protein (DUF1697 family)